MRNILIISKQKEQAKALASLVRPFHFNQIDLTTSAQDARRRIQEQDYNMVIINAPLHHEFGSDLALDIIENESSEVILIGRSDELDQVESKLMGSPIFMVERPIERSRLQRDINYLLNAQKKREKLISQNAKLKNNINSLKNQFRAKLLLMNNLNMTENEAHRYIQKQAMDTRQTPGEIANAIIKLYENK